MLSKLSFRSINFAHISLTFIGLMWVFPFLYHYHQYPIPTYYQEWCTAILGLCAMPLLVTKRYWQQLEIPRIVLLPIGMMLLLSMQYFIGKIPSYEQALLLNMYFLWAALLVMVGHRLRIELGLPLLATVLAAFLVLGAELNALFGILQHYVWHTFLDPIVSAKDSYAVTGNLAQSNHYANYITLGLFSIGWLRLRWSLRAWQTVLLVSPLLFVLVLSGSRSAWLYLSFMAAISYLWQRRDQSYLPLMKYSLWLLLGFVAMQFIVQIPWLAGASGKVTTVERMFNETASGSIRLSLWREAWIIFTQFPFLGAGFGQFGWQHFLLSNELQDMRIVGLYNNAHNLVMQLAAETGLAGVSILFGALGVWLLQAWQEHRTVYHWWGYIVLAVLGIHSLLEYPLWYAHFLGIAAVLLGMLESKAYRLTLNNFKLQNFGRLLAGVALLLGTMPLIQQFQGYQKLEAALQLGKEDINNKAGLRNAMLEAYNFTLVRPYAELYLTGMIVPDAVHLEDKISLNEHAMRFVPIAPLVYRQALLLALSGRFDEANAQFTRSIWMYPADFPAAKADLNWYAMKDPEHFSALLEFATQRYEEHQRAVPGK